MHRTTLALAVLLILVPMAHASKAENEQCKAEMEAKHKAETDKGLADTLTKVHDSFKGVVAIVQGLNQKAKLTSTYFVGVCAPIRDLYDP